MIFIHASCDQPLMNSPITKLSFVIPTLLEESQNRVIYCPHVLGGREACLGGGYRLRCFLHGRANPAPTFFYLYCSPVVGELSLATEGLPLHYHIKCDFENVAFFYPHPFGQTNVSARVTALRCHVERSRIFQLSELKPNLFELFKRAYEKSQIVNISTSTLMFYRSF